MKISGFVSILSLVGLCLVRSAWADIYAYNADNGALNLSNVPSDNRYAILPPVHREVALVPAITKPQPRFANKVQYNQIVAEVARAYGLDSALLHAVISVESRYSSSIVSRKGAVGLMQLMPGTAKRYGVANSFDPVQNLHGGAKYLRDLLKTFNNNINLVLAAYNAGEGAVIRHGNRIPPFRETEDYVPRVLGFYLKYQSEPI